MFGVVAWHIVIIINSKLSDRYFLLTLVIRRIGERRLAGDVLAAAKQVALHHGTLVLQLTAERAVVVLQHHTTCY